MSECLHCNEWCYNCDCGDKDHCGNGYYPIYEKETNTKIGMVHADCIIDYNKSLKEKSNE